jgi:WD40 repeat protein
MEPQEAVELLSANLPSGHEQELRIVAARLAERALPLAVPLVLELANGVLRQQFVNEGKWGETLSRVLRYFNRTPEQRDPAALDAGSVVEPFLGSTQQALGASMETLSEEERARYGELSVFAEDTNIPLNVVKRLWRVTGGLDSSKTEEICVRLAEMSLVQFDQTTGGVQLHPVLRGHLVEQQGGNLRTLHRQLLDTYRPALSTSWADLPEEEGYLWDNLAYHLVEAGLVDELITTVKDARYLSLKAFNRGALAAEQDLLTANIHRSRDHVVTTLRSNFVNTTHLLNQCDTLQDVAGTLHSRIAHQPVLAEIASEAEANLPRPFMTAHHPLPDLPDPSLSRTLLGHQDRVRSCAISDDGSMIVSASADSTVRLWDTLRGTELATFTGHKAPLRSCAISGDGRMIVSASEDGVIKAWDRTRSSEQITLAEYEAPVSSCGISADKQRIVSAYEDGKLMLWESSTGEQLREFAGHTAGVRGCAISADGSVVISASLDGTLKAWNTVTGEEINTLHGHSAGVRDCAVTADGSRAVSASRDYTLKVWDVQRGIPTSTLEGHNAGVNGCAISSDGTVVVSAGRDGTLKVWDADTGTEVKTLRGHSDWVKDCAISADGVVIVSASDDRTLKIWNARREVFRPRVSQHDAEMKGLSVSADGALAACASSDKTLTLWNVRTGYLLKSLEGHSAPVLDCAIDPAEPVVVSASKDTTLKVWNTDTYALRHTLYGHDAAVRTCAVSSEQQIIVSGSADRTLKLWDLDDGRLIHTLVGHRGSILACKISPDASWVISSSHDRTLRLWDTANGTDLRRLSGHTGWVLDCDISPDGRLIASASADHTLKLWDVANGAERLTLRGHRAGVFGCAFNQDGSQIVSASGDHTLRVWDTLTGKCLTSLHVDGRLNACAWSSNGEITAVGSRGVYFLRLVPVGEAGAYEKGKQERMIKNRQPKPEGPQPPPVPPAVENHAAWYRLNDQLSWYDRKSSDNQRWYKQIKRIQITIAAAIPVVSFLQGDWVSYATATMGALIAILEGLQQLGQHNNLWTSYRSTAEQLNHEKYLFLSSGGPYRDLDTSDALKLLSERVEELVSTEHAKWVSDTKQIEQPQGGQEQAAGSAGKETRETVAGSVRRRPRTR